MNQPIENPSRASRRERIERIVFFAAIAFLLFVGGMLIARLGWFPYPIIDDAVTAARASAIQLGWVPDSETGATPVDGERSDSLSGVTLHDPSLAAGGYTVFTSGSDEAAYLIDTAGRIVHRWSMPSSVLRKKFGSDRVPDAPLNWRSIHLYGNGDLLVVLQRANFTPYGFALVKLDKDSRVLWANFGFAHHDVTVGEDGLIYTIGQEIREEGIPGLETLKPPFLEDFVLIMSEDGRTVHRTSIMEAFVGTPFALSVKQLVKTRDWKGDYFHVNAIEPFDSRNTISVIRENQVLVSIRNMDALATLDLRTGKITWLLKGSWLKQHDPDIVNGHVMLFDNRGDFSRGSRSRVLEIDPLTQQLTWQAIVGPGFDLYSGHGASQQPLENGNVLINESVPGRLLELTREGKLAWVFHTSGRDDQTGKFAPAILEARRYPPEYIAFELTEPPGPQENP